VISAAITSFSTHTAPFDDIKVRQAFSHVVDRDAIQEAILGPSGRPAYSWLAPGFPAANGEALADIQKYDPALGKQLLAEAGFPNGEGFPKQTLWLRNENPINQNVANAIASMIKSSWGRRRRGLEQGHRHLMDSLTAKPTQLPFGYVSYGMDFLDPFNMLSVWLSGGRHSWANPEFDAKVKEGASFLGAPEDRTKIFQDAERILVTDVPGVFVYHETPVQRDQTLRQRRVPRAGREWHFEHALAGLLAGADRAGRLYISADVSEYRQAP
jgi:peptide/nickel transport system substrate-binding protein/oligopeptide transport system substrate-binding protein